MIVLATVSECVELDVAAGATEVAAARATADATTTMVPARGRAAWVGERGLGVPDGGATAVLRFPQALQKHPT
ncbi:DAK2 domain-containing protein [Jiangella sp. DSM 45060]|uniref:DAK2 domain-containing protein n=1 Tax=Jiangella sp. DSM 45060 TaxID=1798224 RepID=UPI000B017513|nr:DAK2 domain-containing protein [Jiangella sp. DSM 45060]